MHEGISAKPLSGNTVTGVMKNKAKKTTTHLGAHIFPPVLFPAARPHLSLTQNSHLAFHDTSPLVIFQTSL